MYVGIRIPAAVLGPSMLAILKTQSLALVGVWLLMGRVQVSAAKGILSFEGGWGRRDRKRAGETFVRIPQDMTHSVP